MAKKKTLKTVEPQLTVSPPAGRKIVIVPPSSEQAPTFYANNVWVELSNWDVKFRLGQIIGVSADELRVKDVATVFMSHQHAAAFLGSLQKVLKNLPALQEATQANPADDDDTPH
jgi:hypothetical protein